MTSRNSYYTTPTVKQSKIQLIFLLTNDSGLQVNKDCSRDILPSPSLTEEGGKGVVMASYGLVAGHLAIWLDAMLQTVELPTGVPHLDARLPYVHRDAFTLEKKRRRKMKPKGQKCVGLVLFQTFCGQFCESQFC